jgi:hypothetical protein
MAATLTHAFTPAHHVIAERSLRRPRSRGPRVPALAAIAFVAGVLVAMAPGLAQAPVVGAQPRLLEAPAAPAASSSGLVLSGDDPIGPAPEPGPHPGR